MGDIDVAAKRAMTGTDFVKPAEPAPPQVISLSPADEIMTDEYICFLLLFPISYSSDKQAVYRKLKDGLSLTLSEIPFIGGYLTRVEGAVGQRSQITIDENQGLRLIYRDLTTSDPESGFKHSYHELKQNGFPCSAFDPEKTQPVPFMATKPDPAVMAAQANFISGGLILSICIHHKASDALSLDVVLKVWAKHTAVADVANGNGLVPMSMSRAPMCNGLIGARLQDFPEYRVLDDGSATQPAQSEVVAAAAAAPATSPSPSRLKSPFGPLRLCIVYISASRLADLKSAASPASPSDGWISTNDALCAFVWRHITLARSHVADTLQPRSSSSSPSPQVPLNFAVAVEGRRRMVPPLPADYLGNAVFYCPVTSDFGTVASRAAPLSRVAQLVRGAVSGFDSAKMRGVLGLIDSMPKASDLWIRVYDEPLRGLVVSSWADMGLYGLDWGPELGKVESVRVPNVTLDGGTPMVGIFPRMPDGGLEVLICLEDAAIQALREDEDFMAFAEWKGM